jgi:hypothetical protein
LGRTRCGTAWPHVFWKATRHPDQVRRFLPRGLSYTCRRPKLFMEVDSPLQVLTRQKQPSAGDYPDISVLLLIAIVLPCDLLAYFGQRRCDHNRLCCASRVREHIPRFPLEQASKTSKGGC